MIEFNSTQTTIQQISPANPAWAMWGRHFCGSLEPISTGCVVGYDKREDAKDIRQTETSHLQTLLFFGWDNCGIYAACAHSYLVAAVEK